MPCIFLILNDLVDAPQHAGFHPASNDFFCPHVKIFWKNRLVALDLSFKADDGEAVFHGLVYGVAVGAFGHLIVQLRQHRPLVHNLPFVHKHCTQNTALKVLDGLGALRTNNRTFRMGHFIHAGNSRPDDQT